MPFDMDKWDQQFLFGNCFAEGKPLGGEDLDLMLLSYAHDFAKEFGESPYPGHWEDEAEIRAQIHEFQTSLVSLCKLVEMGVPKEYLLPYRIERVGR